MEFLGLEGASTGDVVLFAILAGATLGGALLTITRRNPVAAVMSLVATFFALAGIYASLSAHFLAVLQVSVYAGAIMVLFIFVVMILNRDEIEPVSFRGIITRAVAVLTFGVATFIAVNLVSATRNTPVLAGPKGEVSLDFGTVAADGMSLFHDFVFPFEAISLLLLVAIVGGIIVSRSHRQEEESVAEAVRMRGVRDAAGPEQRLGPVSPGHADESTHSPHAAASHH